jgi:putative DNA primase/helicase
MSNAVFTRAQYERFWAHEIERLHATGSDQMRGCCPNHNGDNPDTLLVHLDSGFAHCFKCHNDGEAWSMLDFTMLRYGMDATTAREYIRGVVGELQKPSVAPWDFPFPKPTEITNDPWRHGTLAHLIEHYREKFDGEAVDPETGAKRPGWQPYALYVYKSVQRLKLRLRHKETGEKRLVWLAMSARGGWTRPSKVPGELTPPYRAETLASAKEIWLLNGEKAVDRAVAEWKVVATCLPNGEAHWRDEYAKHFAGAEVVYVVTDNDPTGQEHGRFIGGQLARAGLTTRIVALPDLPPKGDLWDFIEAGGTYEVALIDALASPAGDPTYERFRKTREKGAGAKDPPPPPGSFDAGDHPDLVHGYGYSDLDNARRLAAVAAGGLAYVHYLAEPYLTFNSHVWQPGNEFDVYPLCTETLDLLQWQANQVGGEMGQRLYKWAERKKDTGGVHAMIRMARRLVKRQPEEFDSHPLLLNCANGTYDLETRRLYPARREDYLTRAFPFAYETDSRAPNATLQVITEWFGATPDADLNALERADIMLDYVQRVCGYFLTGAVLEKAFFAAYGTGNNGKSTFFWLLEQILGPYAVTINASTLTRGWGRNENTVKADIARTKGARVVFAGEPPEGERFDQALIKALTQGDIAIVGTFKSQQPFQFVPTAKVLLETNHVPQIDTDDPAFLARMHLIHFSAHFPGGEKAGQALRARLVPELPQFFNWCVRGALIYLERGLERPAETQASLAEVRDAQAREDKLQPFVEEYFILGAERHCTLAEIETLYHKWCERFKERPMPRNHLSRRLCERKGIERGNDPSDHHTPAWLKGLEPRLAHMAAANPLSGRDAQYRDD